MRILITLLCIAFLPATHATERALKLSVEGGVLYQTVSDVEIPPGTGTRFSLVDAIGKGPLPYFRLEGFYQIDKHRIRAVIAPLVIEKTGKLNKDIVYNGETFAANTDTIYRYQFNSYRLTYAYNFYQSSQWSWYAGFTGKIRQAEIALKQGNTSSSFPDLGFVPLLHVAGEWRINPSWNVLSDLDALASPYGRAFDFSLFTQYRWNKNWQMGLGYRTVEGGADVDVVYNFAWLHYFGVRLQTVF